MPKEPPLATVRLILLDNKPVILLKAPILAQYFSYYILMTFQMMLSVILLSMLMILLSYLNVIKQLICGNNYKWLLNLNLIYKTLWTGARNDLLISMLEKLNLFCLTSQTKSLVLLIWKSGQVFSWGKIIF